MKKNMRRLLSAALVAVMVTGMCFTASAFTYPSAYWKLHSAWDEAVAAKSPEQVISVAQQTYDLLMPLGLGEDVCYNLEPKAGRASWACEMKGDIDGAILWLERQRTFASWLDQNIRSYKDTLLNVDARMAYLKAAQNVTIYAQSDDSASPYAVGPKTGTWYGTPADSSTTGGSASLIYVTFGDSYSVDYWINYYMDCSPAFREAANGGVIEFAWNFSPEGTAGAQTVLSADSYIEESLRALGSLDVTVLLRVGAEMNNWSDCDPATYIQAFRKVADAASRYSNIQMVFSPDNISNRNRTIADFYPGDQYVDWVGMSTYHNTNYAGYSGTSSYSFDYTGYGNDAYYGLGIYDHDPMVTIKPIIDLAVSHNKPVMVSECGFAYRNSSGTDLTSFAVEQLNWFYSYINMVYPQVKAVFYFNADPDSGFKYMLNGNSSVSSTYQNAIRNNGAYLDEVDGSATGWETLDKTALSAGDSTLKLASYVSFPGKKTNTVKYYVDDKLVHTSTQAPYYYELDLAALGGGSHTVKAEASGGQFSRSSKTYTLNVPGTSTQPADPTPGTQQPSAWAAELIADAKDKKLITDRTEGLYQDQITRLQFAELAVNLIEEATGKEITPSTQSFTDTSDPMVLKAVAAGVTSGKGEGIFAPSDKITRQEICVMLNKVIEYVDQANDSTTLTDTSTQVDASRFNDVDQIADWAKPAVAKLTNNGLMSGKGDGVAPVANTTVEEAIILIRALYDKF